MATPKAVKRAAAKKSHRKPKRSWRVYIGRALKSINSSMSLSGRTVRVIESFLNDQFERIASQAAVLARVNKRSTISARELQAAVRLVLPAELARHAMAEATKAISNAAKN